MLTFQSLEYTATVFMFLKALICLSYREEDVLPDLQLTEMPAFWVMLLSLVYILTHHVINEAFYRKVLTTWEEKIKEDFNEEFATAGRCCFGDSLTSMRYFNFVEWICLWR